MSRSIISTLRAMLVTVMLLVSLLGISITQPFVLKFWPRHATILPRMFFRFFCIYAGASVTMSGTPTPQGVPTLLVANHVSWLDIPVIGSLLPLSFLAKREMASWPFFKFITGLQRTIFITRAQRKDIIEEKALVSSRLKCGDRLVLFAEGTTGNGNYVLPFKSTFLSTVYDAQKKPFPGVVVQPVSIAYRKLNGVPMGRFWRPLYAWYGDMVLFPHARDIFRRGSFEVEVVFHPPAPREAMADRKALAAYCQACVEKSVENSLTAPAAFSASSQASFVA